MSERLEFRHQPDPVLPAEPDQPLDLGGGNRVWSTELGMRLIFIIVINLDKKQINSSACQSWNFCYQFFSRLLIFDRGVKPQIFNLCPTRRQRLRFSRSA